MSFNVSYIANSKVKTEDASTNMIGMDLQGIDTEGLINRGEGLPIYTPETEVIDILSSVPLRNNTAQSSQIQSSVWRKFKTVDFVITNTLNSDVRIAFGYSGSNSSSEIGNGDVTVVLEDGETKIYSLSSTHAHHIVKESARNIPLSSIPLKADGVDAVDPSLFQSLFPFNRIDLKYRASTVPSEGELSIVMLGDPY